MNSIIKPIINPIIKPIIKFKKELFIFVITILILYYYFGFHEYITLKPYYQQKGLFKNKINKIHNFLTIDHCSYISHKIRKNKFVKKNPLNDSFKKSRGILFAFGIDDAYKTLKKKNCLDLYDIFKSIRKPYANRFIMNVLIIKPKKYKKSKNDMAVDYHYDLTLQEVPEKNFLGLEREYLPECVSVLYVDLPKSFQGGELDICTYHFGKTIEKVRPKLGTLVEFNGKYLHGVFKMKDVYPTKSERISIVLEQYSI